MVNSLEVEKESATILCWFVCLLLSDTVGNRRKTPDILLADDYLMLLFIFLIINAFLCFIIFFFYS
jgi:hypothetical protein